MPDQLIVQAFSFYFAQCIKVRYIKANFSLQFLFGSLEFERTIYLKVLIGIPNYTVCPPFLSDVMPV